MCFCNVLLVKEWAYDLMVHGVLILLMESKKLLFTVKWVLPLDEIVYEAASIADVPFDRASFRYLNLLAKSKVSLHASWNIISPFLKRTNDPNSFGFIELDEPPRDSLASF